MYIHMPSIAYVVLNFTYDRYSIRWWIHRRMNKWTECIPRLPSEHIFSVKLSNRLWSSCFSKWRWEYLDRRWNSPTFLICDYRKSFPEENGLGVLLITHLDLALNLKIGGAISPLPPMSSQLYLLSLMRSKIHFQGNDFTKKSQVFLLCYSNEIDTRFCSLSGFWRRRIAL